MQQNVAFYSGKMTEKNCVDHEQELIAVIAALKVCVAAACMASTLT